MVEADGAKVRVMAGESHGVTGPINMRNPGLLLDVQVSQGVTFTQEVSQRANLTYSCQLAFLKREPGSKPKSIGQAALLCNWVAASTICWSNTRGVVGDDCLLV